jgi:hypothetical protein
VSISKESGGTELGSIEECTFRAKPAVIQVSESPRSKINLKQCQIRPDMIK